VGGSSGPMHLASTYGVPIVVWVDSRMSGAESTAQIYLGAGNPHRRPVFLVSDTSFQPPPKQVFDYIREALEVVDRSATHLGASELGLVQGRPQMDARSQ